MSVHFLAPKAAPAAVTPQPAPAVKRQRQPFKSPVTPGFRLYQITGIRGPGSASVNVYPRRSSMFDPARSVSIRVYPCASVARVRPWLVLVRVYPCASVARVLSVAYDADAPEFTLSVQ
jgi:hypothetical protein